MCLWGVNGLKKLLKVDDSLDVFGVHGVGGILGALLTGVGTVLADDPRLDVRLVDTPRQPLRAVVDARLDTPPSARLFEADGPLVFYVAHPDPDRRAAIAERGAEIVALPGAGQANGRVDLAAVIADLSSRPLNELHIEAGPRLNGSLIAADLVDECLIYLAPMLLGQGRGGDRERGAQQEGETRSRTRHGEPLGSAGSREPINADRPIF